MTGEASAQRFVGGAGMTVAVVGGGPIGLAVAWRCAQRGLTVRVYDGAAPVAASVAAGMLSPVAEAYFGEAELTRLLLDSVARWPAFAAELTRASGRDLGYRTEGTLIVALTADDLAQAERLRAYQAGLGLPITGLRGSQLREREPVLAPGVRGGSYAPGDHQVDPRRLLTALRTAATACGVTFLPRTVNDLAEVAADRVVVTAGCGTAALTGLPIRRVKGEILRLRAPGRMAPDFRHVIRGFADGRQVYLVPRANGEVVVGATSDERTDDDVTAGGVLGLLRAATDLVPELTEYALVEADVGHRPGTPDNAPILGELLDHPGVVVASGHYRHGIVLTPLTADLMADLVTGQPPPGWAAAFTPGRFAEVLR